MEEDDQGPNFAYAYADSSWNPALRPHRDEDIVPEQAHQAHPLPPPQQPEDASSATAEAANPSSLLHGSEDNAIPGNTPEMVDEEAGPPVGGTYWATSAAASASTPVVDEGVRASSLEDAPIDRAEEGLQDYDGYGNDEAEQGYAQPATEHDNVRVIADNYEHQGDVTVADEAIDEAATAPLLEDEEALPTPGWDLLSNAKQLDDPLLEYTSHDVPSQYEEVLSYNQLGYEPPWGEKGGAADFVPQLGITLQPAPEGLDLKDSMTASPINDVSAVLEDRTAVLEQEDKVFDWGADEEGAMGFDDELGQALQLSESDQRSQDMRPDTLSNTTSRTFGGVAASKATAFSQVLEEMNEQPSDLSTLADSPPILPGDDAQEDDIAAMWKAALEDDELLDNLDAVDPSDFFADDGEGFLEDSPSEAQREILSPSLPTPVYDDQGRMQGFSTLDRQEPTGQVPPGPARYQPQVVMQQTSSLSRNMAGMPSPQFFDSSLHSRSAATPATDLYGAFRPSAFDAIPTQPQQRPGVKSAQSFADRAKEGYASPYDLPMDIVKSRKRPTQAPAPPPRTSSIPPPRTPGIPPKASQSPLVSSPPSSSQGVRSPPLLQAAKQSPAANSGFFADLPMVPKARSRPSGAYTPVPGAAFIASPPLRPSAPTTQPQPPQAFQGLRQPDRLPLLPDEPAPQPVSQQLQPSVPAAASRYSPSAPSAPLAPAAGSRFSPMPPAAPAATSRYSPAPTSQGPSPALSRYNSATGDLQAAQRAQPFAPRTSSPLAFSERPQLERDMPQSLNRALSYQPVHAVADASKQFSPPKARELPLHQPGMVSSPPSVNGYAPTGQEAPEPVNVPYSPGQSRPADIGFAPPRRSHTQSPGAVMKGPRQIMSQPERPISASTAAGFFAVQPAPRVQQFSLPTHRRQFSTDLNFDIPQDERAADPLERWKGYPICKWGANGILLTSFPKQTPYYGQGHAIPTLRCTAGSITVHDTKTTFPLDDRNAKFPGPLYGKAKGKKKDVLTWLSGKIEDLERANEGALLDLSLPTLVKKRAEEKVVLWKILRLLVEHDNTLEGSTAVTDAARKVLLPGLAQAQASRSPIADGTTQGRPLEVTSARHLAEIRLHLLEGQREKAVWYAAEQKLWSHALIISSTLPPETWKQVVQEFVKAQVKDVGENSQSLAALYEVFAGNVEESVDELVPPSARAGFQMINKSDTYGSNAKNPLDGLDQWRETLGLIIGNRCNNDGQAVAALGKLLASYGRVEASHTCFLYARTLVHHSGADDPEASFVLLGADHKAQKQLLGVELDSILLSEVYEYALSLNPAPGSSAVVPHLQAYKLIHAYELAEHGLRAEAQNYCEAIVGAVKSSTRASPYFHAAFTSAVEDLGRRLSQSPHTNAGSAWLSKLSSEKVSGSVWKRFNTFVAGDEDGKAGNAANADGPGGAGVFSKVSGDTPALSRSTSGTDLYSAMALNGSTPTLGSSAPSRYAPSSVPTTVSPADRTLSGRYAPQGQYTPGAEGLTAGQAVHGRTHIQPQISLQRAISTPYGAYMPQAQAQAPVQRQPETQPDHSLGTLRPEMMRAASDYKVHYSQPTVRRPSMVEEAVSPVSNQPTSHPQTPLNGVYQPDYEGGESQATPPQTTSYSPAGYDPEVQISHGGPVSSGYESPAMQYEPVSYQPPAETSSSDAPSYEPLKESLSSSHEASFYQAPQVGSPYEAPSYNPPEEESSYQAPSYQPDAYSYEPPAESYEAPSYQPYEPDLGAEDPEADSAPQPKKKSFMDLDDEDDMITRQAAALRASPASASNAGPDRAAADRATDDAFRKAAEADAERDKAGADGQKKGWLKGWFGGKKDPNAVPGPIRAKLGEESSFYYDPELKKWVNKKGGPVAEQAAAGTPPPPRGPSRTVSGAGPPSGPASRTASGMGPPPGVASPPQGPVGSGPPSRAGTPAMGAGLPQVGSPPLLVANDMPGPPSGPPSRPATSMSNASSIDDLLGAPAARKAGATAKGKKRGGRYVDVMAK